MSDDHNYCIECGSEMKLTKHKLNEYCRKCGTNAVWLVGKVCVNYWAGHDLFPVEKYCKVCEPNKAKKYTEVEYSGF